MERHFTVTGFVVHGDRTVLLWHRLLQMWVPPGGHVEAHEDPVTALLREIEEETGLRAQVVGAAPRFDFDYPAQVPPPYTILIEDSPEPGNPHQHVDLIYFCRSLDGERLRSPSPDEALVWVSEAQLRQRESLRLAVPGGSGHEAPVTEDVRLLALEAIRAVREARP